MSAEIFFTVCRLTGAVIILFVGAFVSREYKKSVNLTISAARDAEKLVSHIGECIAYSGGRVGDIIASYDGGCDATRAVWTRASSGTLSEALDSPNLPFDAETHAILKDFAAQLGRGYREPQTELCRVFSARIARVADSLESSKEDRLRVSSAVSVFVTLSAIILFI